jgi:hypothetical protein
VRCRNEEECCDISFLPYSGNAGTKHLSAWNYSGLKENTALRRRYSRYQSSGYYK